MKITGVEMKSNNTNVFSFGLNRLSLTDKYLAKTILGLDADEIVSKFYGFGNTTGLGLGRRFFSFGLVKREIVMRIQLNPNFSINETYSDIRDEMYRTISSNRTGVLELRFKAGGAIVSTLSGFITKFEVPYSSEIPELQITIRCNDPILRGVNPVKLNDDELGPNASFLVFDSLSTAPHGFSFGLTFKNAASQLAIQDTEIFPEWLFRVVPNGGFLTGDVLHFSSIQNKKDLYINRFGTVIPVMDRIEPNSLWPILFPGSNEFYISGRTNFDWNYLAYNAAYWGV